MLNGKPLICVSSDVRRMEEDPRRTISEVYETYTEAIANSGGIPILTCDQFPEDMADLCDGLLLTGGPSDLEPELYGEEILNDTVTIMPLRTAFEIPLFKAFLKREKPILGICHGFQLMNVCLGGTLYQDLPTQKGWHHSNDVRHDVFVEEDSVLYRLFGGQFKVNSTHHQAIRDLAPELRLTAKSVEGIPEAYEHRTLPILASQFHPERLTGILWDDRTPDFKPYFDYFVNIVKEHAEK